MSLTTLFSRLAPFAAGLAFAGAAHAGEIVEFYHSELDHYFVTGLATEIQILDAGVQKGWARTGFTFQTFAAGNNALATSVPVCRFYGNPARGLDSHFYSASPAECADVQKRFPEEWLLESTELFRVHSVDPVSGKCPANTKAVYRLWNKRSDVNHRYTSELSVADAMIAKGYVLEGNGDPKRPVVFCSADTPPPPPAAGTPACTLTSSAPMPVINVPVTLTATCTNAPTTYAWINCGSTTSTCTALASQIGTQNYGVVASNAKGPGAPVSVALNWQVAASASPTCTVAATSTTPQLGTPITLTASCSHTPSKFEWLGCSSLLTEVCNPLSECKANVTSCSPIGKQTGPVYYAVVASNTAGNSSKAGIPVSWRSASGTAPPPSSSPSPSCTVTPSSPSPAVGTTLTLTASCTNSPTGFSWQNCASTTDTCTASEATPVTRSYTVRANNASGVGAPATASVTWQKPPTAAPSCTLAANPASPYVGGSLTLTATCSQSPTSYQWVGCSNSSGNTCTVSNNQAGNASYTVTAANSQFGAGAPATRSVTWLAAPPAGTDFCGNYPNVIRVNLPWGGKHDTYGDTGFPDNAIVVGVIRVPANAAGSTVSGVVSVVEYIDGQAHRTMSLSRSACDFRGTSPNVYPPTDSSGVKNPMGWAFGINPNILFSLSTMPGGGVKLIPGQTYYVNIRNRDYAGDASCRTSNCNIRITVNRPG